MKHGFAKAQVSLKCLLVVLFLSSFWFLASCSAVEQLAETIDGKQGSEEIHTTLDELIPAVCKLSIDKAVEQYFNRYYHITGTVKRVGSMDKTNMIMLDGPEFAGSGYSITFFFDASTSIDILRELQEGDTVTVRGYLDGSDYKDLVRFDFYHCTVNKGLS